MAAKYRKISPAIWNDGNFKAFSDNAKLVFFMLLTHPHTSAIGTLRAFLPGLAPELGWSEKAFREAFGEAFAKSMVKVDEKAGLIWLPKFLKHNPPESPNVVKSWVNSYEECPECALKNEVFYNIKDFAEALPEAFREAFGEAFAKSMPNQEQEQEQDKENTPIGVFVPGKPETPAEADETGKEQPPSKADSPPSCPQEAIKDAYHELLPELPRMKTWGGDREKNMRSRWRERWAAHKYRTQSEGVDYFRRLFAYIRDSDFLMGRTTDRQGKSFSASLDWILLPRNFAKIIEGRYHDKGTEAAA
jgi:hypothetical protein